MNLLLLYGLSIRASLVPHIEITADLSAAPQAVGAADEGMGAADELSDTGDVCDAIGVSAENIPKNVPKGAAREV